MNKLLCILFAVAAGAGAVEYRPEFSTAGFYQTDVAVRGAVDFNVGWRFFMGDVAGADS